MLIGAVGGMTSGIDCGRCHSSGSGAFGSVDGLTGAGNNPGGNNTVAGLVVSICGGRHAPVFV